MYNVKINGQTYPFDMGYDELVSCMQNVITYATFHPYLDVEKVNDRTAFNPGNLSEDRDTLDLTGSTYEIVEAETPAVEEIVEAETPEETKKSKK